jgi:hypothetical protein
MNGIAKGPAFPRSGLSPIDAEWDSSPLSLPPPAEPGDRPAQQDQQVRRQPRRDEPFPGTLYGWFAAVLNTLYHVAAWSGVRYWLSRSTASPDR